MVLSDLDIQKYIKSGDITIEPFSSKRLKQITYHFSLNNKIVVPKKTALFDLKSPKNEYEEITIGDDGYVINPGDFLLGQIRERISLSNKITCQLDARSSLARIGLNVLQGSVFVNPGTKEDRITLEITNVGNSPIKIYPGLKIVKGVFMLLSHAAGEYESKYSKQDDPRPKFD